MDIGHSWGRKQIIFVTVNGIGPFIFIDRRNLQQILHSTYLFSHYAILQGRCQGERMITTTPEPEHKDTQ